MQQSYGIAIEVLKVRFNYNMLMTPDDKMKQNKFKNNNKRTIHESKGCFSFFPSVRTGVIAIIQEFFSFFSTYCTLMYL